jgi:hypothetical protein
LKSNKEFVSWDGCWHLLLQFSWYRCTKYMASESHPWIQRTSSFGGS